MSVAESKKNFFFLTPFFPLLAKLDNDLILGSDWFERSGPNHTRKKISLVCMAQREKVSTLAHTILLC